MVFGVPYTVAEEEKTILLQLYFSIAYISAIRPLLTSNKETEPPTFTL